MADVASSRKDAGTQTDEFETSTPDTPHADRAAATKGSALVETPRIKKRREWQEGKIRESREKKLGKQNTPPADQRGRAVSQSPDSELYGALHGSDPHTGTAGRIGQSLRQCIVDAEKGSNDLQSRVGSSTGAIPSQIPNHEHAPCIDQLVAAVAETISTNVRRELVTIAADIHRNSCLEQMGTKPMQQSWQPQPGYTPPTSSQRTLYRGIEPTVQYTGPFQLAFNPNDLRQSHGVHAIPHSSAQRHSPLYNLNSPDPFYQQSFGAIATSEYNQKQMAQSESSATQAGDLEWTSPGGQAVVAHTLKNRDTRATTPVTRSDIDDNLAGITPSTPVTICVEDFENEYLETASGQAHFAAVMPDFASSNCAPRLSADGCDWDTATKVPEGLEGQEVEDLTVSRTLIDKLMGDGEKMVISVVRSSTSPPSCRAPVSVFLLSSLFFNR
jgi:hypothetical protein